MEPSGEDVQQATGHLDMELEGRNQRHPFGCHLYIVLIKLEAYKRGPV